jgi:hypothetical protein
MSNVRYGIETKVKWWFQWDVLQFQKNMLRKFKGFQK